ncbi:MAG: zinc carboxypeptidase [Planctomycetes bacterium]|nr:zinc carboxypeptidase [Planctomycetota bacterium]
MIWALFDSASLAGERLSLVRVHIQEPAALDRLLLHGFDIATIHQADPAGGEGAPRAADLVVTRGEARALRLLGFRPRLLLPDLEGHFAQALGPVEKVAVPAPPGFGQGAMGGYYTFAEVESLLDHYAQSYPGIVSAKQSIGTSVEGRPIWAIKVSDHPSQAENEPRVLIDALHHAREPASMQTLLLLLHHLASTYGADPVVTSIVDERELWFVPVVNPDGYVYNESTNPGGGGMWRKNRRLSGAGCAGVDLNRNYAAQWGFDDYGSSGDPCKETYRGPAAASEPETQALAAFAAALGCDVVVSLHSYGRQMVHPLGYADLAPANLAALEEHGAELALLNGYLAGAVSVVQAPANGNALDQHYLASGAEAWAFEVGTSFWPIMDEMVAAAAENVEPLRLLARLAGSRLAVAGHRVLDGAGDNNGCADPGETVDLEVTVRNSGLRASGAASVTLASSDAAVAIIAGQAALAPAASLADVSTSALRLHVAEAAAPGQRARLTLTLDCDGFSVASEVLLDIGTPRVILADDMERDLGWSAGQAGDDALTGKWKRDDPRQILQGLDLAQPEDDATPAPGRFCYVTGNNGTAAGQDDVDDGKTTLLSPRFSLAAAWDARVCWRRWYWCSIADDPFVIDISNDDGAHWTNLETVTGKPNEWLQVERRVADFVAPTSQMRLRFIAADPLNTSVTEALVDDFLVLDFGAAPHLALLGSGALGADIEVQVAAPAGARFFLLAAPQAGAAAVAGVQGTLGLDLASLVLVLDATVPAEGLARVPATVPQDPLLAGATIFLQAAVLSGPPALSNVASVALVHP